MTPSALTTIHRRFCKLSAYILFLMAFYGLYGMRALYFSTLAPWLICPKTNQRRGDKVRKFAPLLGINRDDNTHTGAKGWLPCIVQQHQPHRHSLHDFHPITRRILWGLKRTVGT